MVLVVQLQQSLVHLWVQGNPVLLAVLGIQVYLADLIDPSVLVVLSECDIPIYKDIITVALLAYVDYIKTDLIEPISELHVILSLLLISKDIGQKIKSAS